MLTIETFLEHQIKNYLDYYLGQIPVSFFFQTDVCFQ